MARMVERANPGTLLWSASPSGVSANSWSGIYVRRPNHGKIYVATLDGGLIALDQRSGTPVWTVQTTDPAQPYSITAASPEIR
jgi:outer membrane protein assembly factor BamB